MVGVASMLAPHSVRAAATVQHEAPSLGFYLRGFLLPTTARAACPSYPCPSVERLSRITCSCSCRTRWLVLLGVHGLNDLTTDAMGEVEACRPAARHWGELTDIQHDAVLIVTNVHTGRWS